MFFNELDMLEIRLNVLNDKVDYFVMVEAKTTHSGEKKELFFEKNKVRFSKFFDKIIYIIVDDMPKIVNGDRWPSDTFQRNAIMRGLKNCKDNDIIIISDLDEIPNLENFEAIKKQLIINGSKNDYLYNNIYIPFKRWLSNIKSKSKIIHYIRVASNIFAIKSDRMIMFKQNIYYYFLNGFVHDHWIGTKMVLYKDLIGQFHSTPQEVRNSVANTMIKNGGWHFSYLASPENISWKMKSITHKEFDKPELTNPTLIKERIEKGESIFGGKDKITYIKIDNSFPKYILENTEKYSSYINK